MTKKCLHVGMEPAVITLMKNKGHEAKIYAVVQFGGSTGEYYMHTFSRERLAKAYIRSAERASYESIGPFEVPLPAEGELTRVVTRTVKWLKKEGYGGDKHTLDLERAVLEVKKDLSLT